MFYKSKIFLNLVIFRELSISTAAKKSTVKYSIRYFSNNYLYIYVIKICLTTFQQTVVNFSFFQPNMHDFLRVFQIKWIQKQ